MALREGEKILSAMRGLSRQRRASSGRYSRLETQRAPYRGLGTFSMAPVQNELSGGPPPKDYEMPVRTAAEGWVGVETPENKFGGTFEERLAMAALGKDARSLIGKKGTGAAVKAGTVAALGFPTAAPQVALSTLLSKTLPFQIANVGIPYGLAAKGLAPELEKTFEGEVMGDMDAGEALRSIYSAAQDVENPAYGEEHIISPGAAVKSRALIEEAMPKARPLSTQYITEPVKKLIKGLKGGTNEGFDPSGSLEQDVMESGRGIGWSGETTGDYSIDSMQDVGPRGEFEPSEASGGIRGPSSFGNIGGEIAEAEAGMDVGDWDFDFDWD